MHKELTDNVKAKMNNTVEKSKHVKAKVGSTAKKGKKGFFTLVFSRFGIVILLLAIQLGFAISFLIWLSDYFVYLYSGYILVSILLIIHILNKYDNPMYMLAWMIPILVIPVFGAMMYIFIQAKLGTRPIAKELNENIIKTKPLLKAKPEVSASLQKQDSNVAGLARYIEEYGGYPVYNNTSVEYFPQGIDKFNCLVEELKKAEKFIFMEYFIVKEGYMWNTILEILEQKAAEGVEVRFMYDGMCSLMLLPYNYVEKLRAKGIKAKVFSRIYPAVSTRQNNRDHRKIVVIDGKTAFTGGVNLADEYINREERFGHWKDTAIMLKGDAVRNFTLMFLQMWNIFERVPEHYEAYLPKSQPIVNGTGYVIAYGDTPLDNETVGEQVYLQIIHSAKKYVHIMTPYLVLDYEMQQALEYAAKRGVEVSVILPHIPDKKYAFLLAKTYYRDLITAGVHIYEYTPGFIHAKVFVSDDEKAVVGTINLDFRSLYLHFECAAYLYQCSEILKIEQDFQETAELSHEVSLEECKKQKLLSRFAGKCLRLLAPLM